MHLHVGRELVNTPVGGLGRVRFGAVSGLPSRRAALPDRAKSGHCSRRLAAAMSPASPIARDQGSSGRGSQGLGTNVPAATLAV